MAAVQQLPLQYSIGSDYDLQTRLCSKGLKGALLPRAHGRMGSDGAVERLPSPGHPLCTPAVVEVYSEWCGPCRSVLPTFKRVRTERDDEAAILFLTVGVRSPQQRRRRGGSAGGPLPRSLRAAPGPAPPTQKQQGLALSAVGGVCPRLAAMPAGHPTKEPPPPLPHGRCRLGRCSLATACARPAPPHRPRRPCAQVPAEKCDYLESAKEHRGKSEPLFLMYRNGTLKSRIHGANLPALVASISELTPNNPEMDDLEVRAARAQERAWGRGAPAAAPVGLPAIGCVQGCMGGQTCWEREAHHPLLTHTGVCVCPVRLQENPLYVARSKGGGVAAPAGK